MASVTVELKTLKTVRTGDSYWQFMLKLYNDEGINLTVLINGIKDKYSITHQEPATCWKKSYNWIVKFQGTLMIRNDEYHLYYVDYGMNKKIIFKESCIITRL